MIKNSIRLFFLHGFSLAIGFFSNYILVKLSGVSVYGSYVYIFNFLYLLAGFCIFGMDTLLVKKVSVYDNGREYQKLKAIIFFAIRVAIMGSIFVSLVSVIVIKLTGASNNFGNINWFALALSSLLMISISLISQSSLQGLKKIFLSQVSDKLLRPLLAILSLLLLFSLRKKVSLEEMVWINVAAIGIAMLASVFFLKKIIWSKIKSIKPKYDIRDWGSSALTFFIIGFFYVLNSRVNIFFIGLLKGNDEVAVYNIILKISESTGFGLMIINFVLAPLIAKLFSNGELVQLQKLMTRSAQVILFITVPVILIILIFRENILLLFGKEFLNGQSPLLILCAGQLINILFGSVGLLLMMTGNQRYSIYSLVVSTSFNIVLNVSLVPQYGVMGASIANAVSLLIWNCLMYLFVRRKIKIRPTAFGVI